MHDFDYYADYRPTSESSGLVKPNCLDRPMTFDELRTLSQSELMEVGCHGYYHQPLSASYFKYLDKELRQCLNVLDKELSVRPRYFALPNCIYTKQVVKQLYSTFEKVLTIDGIPFKPQDRLIHRVNLTNPNLSGSLISQIDKNTILPRRLRRMLRVKNKLWL